MSAPTAGLHDAPQSRAAWRMDNVPLPLRARPIPAGFCPIAPSGRQALFLGLNDFKEILYGGAAGGGKSMALLMAALQYVDVPGYSALLLRSSFPELAMSGGLMDVANTWLGGTAAHWNQARKTWTFPSGATITFGYLARDKDRYRYHSASFQFIGFDELTSFVRPHYTYLFSRLRRPLGFPVPLRMRAASNPGGAGHQWVFERFVAQPPTRARAFLPARLEDNPHVDRPAYESMLSELDPITQQQLRDGLWVVDFGSRVYQRRWWVPASTRWASLLEPRPVARWISWDTAFKDTKGAAYTVAVVVELLPDYRLRVVDVFREKLTFPDLVPAMVGLAGRWDADGLLRGVVIEDHASGTSAYQTLAQVSPDWLAPLIVPFRPTSSKQERARQAAVWSKFGCILLPHPRPDAPWLFDFERELFSFPESEYADQVDAYSQAVLYLEHLVAEGWRAREGVAAESESA